MLSATDPAGNVTRYEYDATGRVTAKTDAAGKIIKFDDVKQSVKEFLVERQLESLMKDLRAALGRDVLTAMKITEPILRDQFEKQTTKREEELRDRNDIRRQWERRLQQQREATTQSATAPATAPTTR